MADRKGLEDSHRQKWFSLPELQYSHSQWRFWKPGMILLRPREFNIIRTKSCIESENFVIPAKPVAFLPWKIQERLPNQFRPLVFWLKRNQKSGDGFYNLEHPDWCRISLPGNILDFLFLREFVQQTLQFRLGKNLNVTSVVSISGNIPRSHIPIPDCIIKIQPAQFGKMNFVSRTAGTSGMISSSRVSYWSQNSSRFLGLQDYI